MVLPGGKKLFACLTVSKLFLLSMMQSPPYFLYLHQMRRNLAILLMLSLSTVLFAQKQDTLKPRIIKQWNLSPDLTEEVVVPFDTVFSLSNRYRITDQYSPFNATLGSYGLPFYQISFFDRPADPDKFIYSYYYPLMYQPERYLFMNTQVPFTELNWTFAGNRETSEQTFRVRHSQNVNKDFNFGLIYDIVYNLGQYSYQRAIDKDFTFFTSYKDKKEKYKLYFAAGINNLSANENGGISDAGQLSTFDTPDVEVNLGGLNEALSSLRNRNLMLVQRYTIGGIKSYVTDTTTLKGSNKAIRLNGTFSHFFVLDNTHHSYSDNSPGSGFYDTTYISKNADATYDSLFTRSIKNTIRFDFATDETRKFRLGGGVGIRNELFKYGQIMPSHYSSAYPDTASWHKSNNVLVGRLFNNIGDKFRWGATGEFYLTGYRMGDFDLKGVISQSFEFKKGKALWSINAGMSGIKPSLWYERWSSYHFKWDNNLNKEFRLSLGTDFSYPARNMEIKLNYSIIDNYTDFDTNALPSQFSGGLSVASAYIKKDLRAWKFHLTTDLLIQQSSNSGILDLPLATVRSAGFFEHLFVFKKTNGDLNTQVGAEVLYHTLYHPYNYMPATGRFYRQTAIETGNYPFINVFLNLKIRRTRIFLMLDHANAGMMGYDYYMVPSYPMNTRMLRYGLSWTFYN